MTWEDVLVAQASGCSLVPEKLENYFQPIRLTEPGWILIKTDELRSVLFAHFGKGPFAV